MFHPTQALHELQIRKANLTQHKNVEHTIHGLKIGLISNLNDYHTLEQLGSLTFSMGYLEDAKFYYSKALAIAQPTQVTELYHELFLIETAMQLKYDDFVVDRPTHFLDHFIRYLYECSTQNHVFNLDIDWISYLGVAITDRAFIDTNTEMRQFFDHVDGLLYLYDRLSNDDSRNVLINVIALRIWGGKRVKSVLNDSAYWRRRSLILGLSQPNDVIYNNHWALPLYDLSKMGYPISLYSMNVVISNTFMEKQYEYVGSNHRIKAQAGDVVIDAGGCWGDTALYFAHEVGEDGQVYSFEFIPSNINTMKKNLDLNPHLRDRVTIIEQPVWNTSDQLCYYLDNGPASTVSNTKIEGGTGETVTLSIDDLVIRNDIKKVDFIKMDVECAEMKALQGAVKAITKFKPTLAIAVYHHMADFGDICRFISELNLGYQFFLGHYTITREETVLFAVTE
ncbi:FkbM family methyltransferase [Croceifilum oryzae]|uniref:FkbM family methyltransferase n=1 Tax=Croceifilum oryzae TaxID=1553429 RepID=A0AAJ1TGB1_9BACL|nr:FkbM family methyltransferase [Croceifilum oryzae]MDQ0418353.1 FkbM family methyltransferase [Croceifilum oryzae]